MHKTEPQYAIDDRFLDQRYSLAGRLIDPVSGTLSWQGNSEHLRRKELEVLALLASAEGKQVMRENFIAVVWQGNDLVGDRGLTNAIVCLRRFLRDENAEQPLIRTISRRGYQLAVQTVDPAAQQAGVHAPQLQLLSPLVPGAVVPDCLGWRLLRRLGESSISESWLAEPSEASEADQGLRVFRFCRSEAHLQRLRREVTLLRYLRDALGSSPHFALIHDWQLDEPPYFLARDYTAFGNFSQWGGLTDTPLAQRMAMMQGLSDAVAAMHAHGVVHRQLSAETILVDASESGPQLKISAFDLAALSDRSKLEPLKITALGLTHGVEDAAVELTAADDVYALGVVLLQLALGDVQAQPSACLSKVADGKLQALLSRCFSPAEAQITAGELAVQLRALDGSVAPEAPEARAVATPEPPALPVTPRAAPEALESIGPYRLIDKLGEGGMGTVYLAEQREPVQRQVALKLIKTGMDTAQVLARFEAERQALALMNHVNVAAVFEAGSSASGRPYFAMEYVPGAEITKHCDQRELDFRGRIELFLQVCDGVLHAHQKGIIHRDLKPSNILIKSAQGQPATAKIIDFGVAKSLQRKLGYLTAHTLLGSFVGTPTYSSPEQINSNSGDVDTRADIYSLGVVLYELLAGVTPYSEAALASKSPLELSRMLSSQDPPPLLSRFASLDEPSETVIAQCRSMSIAQMKQTLGSDLSWIVAKCLERDPNERYASVLELEKDLKRWLENRPVEARPITWTYRVRKMVRRNWGAVSVAAAVALALILATTASVISFVRAERAREEAEQVADFQAKQMRNMDPAAMGLGLREEFLKAVQQRGVQQGLSAAALETRQQQIQELIDGLSFTDLGVSQLDRYYLNPALAAIESDFSESPLLQAKLWNSVLAIQESMGHYQAALDVQERVLAQYRQFLGDNALPTIIAIRTRAELRNELSQIGEAESDFRLAAAAARENLGREHRETLETACALGSFLAENSRFEEGLPMLREALEKTRQILGKNDPQTLRCIGSLASALFYRGEIESALVLEKEALETNSLIFGAKSQEVIQSKMDLASVLGSIHEFEQAEKYAREALSQARASLGDQHPLTLNAMDISASVAGKLGQLDDAEKLYREALHGSVELLGKHDLTTLHYHSNLANTLNKQCRFREAELASREVLNGYQQTVGLDNLNATFTMSTLARSLVSSGKFDEGISQLQNSLSIRQKLLGVEDPRTLQSQADLASGFHVAGRLDEAEAMFSKTVLSMDRALGAKAAATLRTRSEFARLINARGRNAQAESEFREILAEQGKLSGDNKLSFFDTVGQLSAVLRAQNKLTEALSLGQQMMAAGEQVRNNNYEFGLLQLNHAHTLAKLRRFAEAEQMYLAAYKNITRWSEEARRPLKELAQGMLELYAAWNAATPSAELLAKSKTWRAKLLVFASGSSR